MEITLDGKGDPRMSEATAKANDLSQPEVTQARRTTNLGRLAAILLAVLFVSMFDVPAAAAAEVGELIRHIDRLWRGETSHAMMSMTVKTSRYERQMSMEAWSKGADYSLVVIQEPVKDRGIATLKVENNIWNYLPKINRVTKIPSSLMSGSWMGSHFTNDDLVRESTFEDDYTTTITFEGERDGASIYELTSIPKPDAPVVWGKVVMAVDQKTLAPLRALYYDEGGALIRTLTFDRLEQLDGRVVPMRLTLQPEDKPGESTVIAYGDIEFGAPLDESFFSLQSLQRRR
jgi:outer membrane lipoprotein-sorting protein